MNISDPFRYFNAGFIVFNCRAMRRALGPSDLLKMAAADTYIIMDQDILNQRCGEHVLLLGYEWNMPPDSPAGVGDAAARKQDYIDCAPEELKSKYRRAHDHPKIIHYTDTGKPWFYPNEDMADIFWEVARHTPFFETLLFRLYDHQAKDKVGRLSPSSATIVPVPQGHLFKHTVKRVVRIFLPYGTKRRAFVKKYYFKLRGWSV